MQYKSHEFDAGSNSFAVKIEDLVREIIIQNDIPYCRIESGAAAAGIEHMPVIRIVTYFEDTVKKISDLLYREFELHIEKPTNKSTHVETFAYKGTHYIATLTNARQQQTEYRRTGNKKFELQVCSLLQEVWEQMENELGDGTVPDDETKRDLYRISALLETADKEFRKIRNEHDKNILSKDATSSAKTNVAETETGKGATNLLEHINSVAKEVLGKLPGTREHEVSPPPAEQKAEPATNGRLREAGTKSNGSIQKAIEMLRENGVKKHVQLQPEENVLITDALLKDYVLNSKLVKELDQKIAESTSAKLTTRVDIAGDMERLQFLRIYTLKQLNDKVTENKDDIIAFAEKWIGKDHGGSFDSGISLFYMEYLLVAKKNDPAFAREYVLKFISENDYSAQHIIPTYNAIST